MKARTLAAVGAWVACMGVAVAISIGIGAVTGEERWPIVLLIGIPIGGIGSVCGIVAAAAIHGASPERRLTMTDEEYREKARQQYGKDGEIEIDDDAAVNRDPPEETTHFEDGAYVQAWVWVAS